jgi:hypothetical protein
MAARRQVDSNKRGITVYGVKCDEDRLYPEWTSMKFNVM